MNLKNIRALLPVVAAISLGWAGSAAHAAHPLVTDDTGTQGTGHWQLELSSDHTRVRGEEGSSWERETAVALTRGLSDTLDLAVGLPWLRVSEPGAAASGVGDASITAKWRFYENQNGWSLALRPTMTLPTGSASKGFGNGRAGADVALISTLEQGDWTWLANLGYAWNNNKTGDRTHLWAASTAVLYALTAQWTLAADIAISRSADRESGNEKIALIGAIWHVNDDLDLDIGWRRSLGSTPVAHTLGVGLAWRW